MPVPVSARPPPASAESIVAVPERTVIVPPQEGSVIVPPSIVASPSTVIALTFTRPEILILEPAASTTLLPSIQGVGVPSASCHWPVVQSPSPDQ